MVVDVLSTVLPYTYVQYFPLYRKYCSAVGKWAGRCAITLLLKNGSSTVHAVVPLVGVPVWRYYEYMYNVSAPHFKIRNAVF